MNMTMWIILAIVVILVLALIVLVVVGNRRKEAKIVRFEEKEQKELTQQEKSGDYQAKGGFNFAPAAPAEVKEPELLPGQELGGTAAAATPPAPKVEESEPEPKMAAPTVEPTPAPKVEPTPEPEPKMAAPTVEPTPEPEPKAGTEAETREEKDPGAYVTYDAVHPDADDSEVVVTGEPAGEKAYVTYESHHEETEAEEQVDETERLSGAGAAVAGGAGGAVIAGAAAASGVTEPASEPEVAEEPEVIEEAVGAAEAAQVTVESATEALETTPVPATEPAPAPEPIEEIAPAAGRIGRLRGRLSRSQSAIGQGVLGILTAGDLDEDAWEEIEDTLLMADLGTKVTMDVVDSLRDKIAERGVSSEAEARAFLREALIEACHPEMDRSIKAMPYEGKPAVILVVGVNGTGKTTTTGKLARVLVSMGHKVLLGAADTFRAAAADQLETWGRRVGAATVRGAEGADPASVAFDAVARGVAEQADVVLVDTAGRLHTATGLMDQLGKVKRVVEKKTAVDEVLLVLDATVGQNGLTQARVFREVVDITGIALTKLDGTAKGGIVFQVQEELGVPVKLVGLGEGADDLAPFEVEGFVDALLG
ncbi:signal recognition particle-docking protein FtsY [Corynebacterium sp. YIM 101645]|uniref:Signal recognition particle receptor FtsY n=1 Tax=Corynebacterium lemuris TaxID=1859292 RepID=A0ABT2FVN2_9CORY|nr:signal recognition particle-docking protein FtsY [Corynebacterium lemuris]MCS5479292.1 signal recognition particle-docking protein FtsY [Corynebacterium lemuris]